MSSAAATAPPSSPGDQRDVVTSLREALGVGVALEEDAPHDDAAIALDSPEEQAKMKEMEEAGRDLPEFQQADGFWRLATLRARKYNVARALELLKRYMAFRAQFKIDSVLEQPQFMALIRSGVFAVAGNRDRQGRSIVTIRLKLAEPSRFSTLDMLLGGHAALELALRRFPEAQAHGLTFVNDMTDASFSNLDLRSPKLSASAASKTLPLRFGNIIILKPLLILRIVMPLVRPFLSAKMKERLHVAHTLEDLDQLIDEDNRWVEHGGKFVNDPSLFEKWVLETYSRKEPSGGAADGAAGREGSGEAVAAPAAAAAAVVVAPHA